MKVLIIGGTGILSTAVVNEAINRGYDVTMVNRGNNAIFINEKAELITCDVRKDINRLASLLNNRRFDVVIDFLVWTKEQLAASLASLGKLAKQYVFISSAQVYNTSITQVLKENSEKIQKLWNYSIHKHEAELFLKDYCGKNGINYTIIRPGVNYGDTRIPYGMYPQMGFHWTLVERIKAGKPIVTWNKGLNKLNLTRVEDFAAGAVGLLGEEKALNEEFNVVGDFVYSWMDVLTTLGELLKIDVKTIDIPVDFYSKYYSGDQKEALVGGRACDLVCSNEKLKGVVPHFTTKYDLREGVKKTIEFYRNNNYYKGFDYRYDALQDLVIKDFSKLHKLKYDNIGFKNYGNDNLKGRMKNRIVYAKTYYQNSKIIQFFRRLKHAVKL